MATSTTRLTILQRAAPFLGGYQGNITSGTATTAVLAGLVGVLSDDELIDWLLVMPDAANDADQTRVLSDSTGNSGSVTWSGNRTDTTYTSETYFLLPKNSWTLQECRQAVSTVLRKTKRTYRYVVPTRDDERHYSLVDLSWLRNKDDVDGTYVRHSPNMVFNAAFDYWHSGTTSAPDGWTLTGSGGTIARRTTFASYGSYEAAVTRAGTDVTLTYDLPYQLAKQLIDDTATVAIKVRCTTGTASIGRVGINDGVDTTWSSSYHSGDGEPEDLTASRALTAAASRVRVVLSVDTSDGTVGFDFAPMVEDTAVPDALWLGGDGGYHELPFDGRPENTGSGVVELVCRSAYSRKSQLVVVSRRPYADLTTDAASTEAPSDLMEAGLIYTLASLRKPGMDDARPAALRAEWGPVYTALADGQIDKPIQEPQVAHYVRGA